MATIKPADPAAPPDEFAAVAALAATVEGDAAPPGQDAGQAQPGPPGDPADRDAAELLLQLKMARGLVAGRFKWWPDFKAVWGDDTLGAIAQALAEVMALHGLSVSAVWGRFGPYIALAFAVGTPSWITWEAMQERRELDRQARVRPAPTPAPAPAEGG